MASLAKKNIYSDNFNYNCPINSKDYTVMNILRIYQHLQKNDNKSLMDLLDQNVVWTYEGPKNGVGKNVIPFNGAFIGKKGVNNFWRIYLKAISIYKTKLRYYLHEGNIIHLHWTDEGIVKSTGKRFLMDTVQRWEFTDKGKIIRFRWCIDSFALYQAFCPNSDPKLSINPFPEDYDINGDGPVDALPIVQKIYNDYIKGDFQAVLNIVAADNVFIIPGPVGISPIAGAYIGPDGLQNGFFKKLFDSAKYLSYQALNFTTDGCRVDVEFAEEQLCFATNTVVRCTGIHSFVINSKGQLAKFRSYHTTYDLTVGYGYQD